jgi:GNAT superfamily N-acetyltransferase
MAGTSIAVRQARPGDEADVVAFTEDTWSDRGGDDYVPDAFADWVASDGPDQRTFVATAGDDVAGLMQAVLLSDYEAWLQGMRVHPDHRGRGVAGHLNRAGIDWARERGAAVARLMTFSWNVAALGAARKDGFGAGTQFRWAHPAPDADAAGADGRPLVRSAPDDAYALWTRSDAAAHLNGVALDLGETWALSELTRADLAAADATLAVGEPVRGVAYRTRTYERADDDGVERTWAEYGVGAWTELDACRDLWAAVARDAAAVGADRTRVLIPETTRHCVEAARAGAELSEEPDFVLERDLTDA